MNILEVLQIVGYGTGSLMTAWMSLLLVRRRHLRPAEKILLALGLSISIWHATNLIVFFVSFLGLPADHWTTTLRILESLAVIAITATYSFLLHLHLYIYAESSGRSLTGFERARTALSYLPLLFLPMAIAVVWSGVYAPLATKFLDAKLPWIPAVSYLRAFSLWAIYVLVLVAVTDILAARRLASAKESRFLSSLAVSFIIVAVLVFLHGAANLGAGGILGSYLETAANLGSLIPTILIGYYIYRYRYFQLIIRESLIWATFAVSMLFIYLVFVRALSHWLSDRLGLRDAAVESLMILGLVLVAIPIQQWLERRFHSLFAQEASLYREVVTQIAGFKGKYNLLPLLLRRIEEDISSMLGLESVRIYAFHLTEQGAGSRELDGEVNDIRARFRNGKAGTDSETSEIKLGDNRIAFPLNRDSDLVGLMLVGGSDDSLSFDTKSVLRVLSSQIALAIDDAKLIEENVRLERELAHKEKLASLGQMAATVAHEVRNPLSAIKSIAQVMNEDSAVNRAYGRDLQLIVGETDRLNRSVSQLLNFARSPQPVAETVTTASVVDEILSLCRSEASAKQIKLTSKADPPRALSATAGQAVKEALLNLVLNAIQSAGIGARVSVEYFEEENSLVFAVDDSGPGLAGDIRSEIWKPFFTTRQRGTGLGLSIVRRRMEEAGGTALLCDTSTLGGARFELRLPAPK